MTSELDFLRERVQSLLMSLTDELVRFEGVWVCTKCKGKGLLTGREADLMDRCLVEHNSECPLYPCMYDNGITISTQYYNEVYKLR